MNSDGGPANHKTRAPDFTILIPTWNNLDYLKNCIQSIHQHTFYKPEILVFVNEGTDGSLSWVKKEQIQFLHSTENVGICTALNRLRKLTKTDIICYLNDDMYVLPHWDRPIIENIRKRNNDFFLYSSTMIEPVDTGNRVVVVADYGTDLDQFSPTSLVGQYARYIRRDWNGSSWPPLFLSSSLWDEVGGWSEEFSPGLYSDPDLAMKAWEKGVREFRGFGNSLVYHFGSKSTRRLMNRRGKQIFLLKWGISASFLYTRILKMGTPYQGRLPEYKIPLLHRLLHFTKRMFK